MIGWYSEGLKTNPGAELVLADTGPLGGKHYRVALLCWASIGMEMLFEVRTAGNTATLHSQVIPVTFSFQPVLLPLRLLPDLNERFRLITRAAVTGEVQATIICL